MAWKEKTQVKYRYLRFTWVLTRYIWVLSLLSTTADKSMEEHISLIVCIIAYSYTLSSAEIIYLENKTFYRTTICVTYCVTAPYEHANNTRTVWTKLCSELCCLNRLIVPDAVIGMGGVRLSGVLLKYGLCFYFKTAIILKQSLQRALTDKSRQKQNTQK